MSTGETKNTGGFLGVWKNKFIFAIVVKTWIDNIYIMFTKILYIYVYFSFIVCFFTIFYRPVLIRVHWVREQPLICHLLSSHGCQTLTGLRQLLHADRRRASKWVAPSERWTQLMGFYLHLQEAWHESLAKRETTNEWMNEWINGNQILLVSSTIPLIPFSWDLRGILNRDSFHSQGVEAPETARVRGSHLWLDRVPKGWNSWIEMDEFHRWYSSFVIPQLLVSTLHLHIWRVQIHHDKQYNCIY